MSPVPHIYSFIQLTSLYLSKLGFGHTKVRWSPIMPFSGSSSYVVPHSASCPSASSTPTTSPSSSTSSSSSESGAIAGEVIGVLGFLAALIFFGMWFRLYRQQHRKPEFAQTFMQTSGNNGNGHGVVLTPVIVTPYDGPAPTQRIASWMRRLYRPSKYLDEADMKEANIGDDSDTTRSMR